MQQRYVITNYFGNKTKGHDDHKRRKQDRAIKNPFIDFTGYTSAAYISLSEFYCFCSMQCCKGQGLMKILTNSLVWRGTSKIWMDTLKRTFVPREQGEFWPTNIYSARPALHLVFSFPLTTWTRVGYASFLIRQYYIIQHAAALAPKLSLRPFPTIYRDFLMELDHCCVFTFFSFKKKHFKYIFTLFYFYKTSLNFYHQSTCLCSVIEHINSSLAG